MGELQDQVVDEWTYAEKLDPAVYHQRMVGHWDTFVTKTDLEDLVLAGISHVRIPVGYWYWDVEEGEPFPTPNMNVTAPASPRTADPATWPKCVQQQRCTEVPEPDTNATVSPH